MIKIYYLIYASFSFYSCFARYYFNNYSSSKDNKDLINVVQQLQISDEKINSVFQNSFNFINYDPSVQAIKKWKKTLKDLKILGLT